MATTTEFKKSATGSDNVTLKVKSSTTSVDATTSDSAPAFPSGKSISIARSQENFTSSAVKAVPS